MGRRALFGDDRNKTISDKLGNTRTASAALLAERGERTGRRNRQDDTDARNRETSRKEIGAWMSAPPENAFVYYNDAITEVQNWMGVKMGDIVHKGAVRSPFGGRVRSVRVRGTNGVMYHGTCNLSSGNYCRLRRSKGEDR